MTNQQNGKLPSQTLGEGNALNLRDGTSGGPITEHLLSVMQQELQDKKWDTLYGAHLNVMYNRGINGSLGLPADVILFTMSKGAFSACIPLHVAATRTTDIETRRINSVDRKTGQTLTTEVPRFISEVHQGDFVKLCKKVQLEQHGLKKVTILQSAVLHHTEMSDREAISITSKAMSRVFNHVVLFMSDEVTPLSLASIHSEKDSRIDTNIAMAPENSVDDMGVPRADTACMTITYQKTSGGNGSGSMIQSRSNTTVGTVHVRGSFVASNNPTPGIDPNTKMPDTTGTIWNGAYIPQVIVDDVDMGVQGSFSRFLLLMASSSRFMDRDIIPKMYSEASVGFLNYRCNIGGEEVPKAIDIEAYPGCYLDFYNKMVTSTAMLSLIIRPGSWNYEYTQWFHRAALGDETAIVHIARQVCEMTGETYQKGMYEDLVVPNVEEHVVGSYSFSDSSGTTAGMSTCSLSEIDELWLNIHMSGNSDMVNIWRESQATHEVDVGLALKFRLIGDVTQHTEVIIDRRYLVTFAPAFFRLCTLINDSLASKDVNNFSRFNGPVSDTWSSHMHAAGAVPLSGSMSQSNMNVNQLYLYNQQQQAYAQQPAYQPQGFPNGNNNGGYYQR